LPVHSLFGHIQLLRMPTPSLILVPARFKTGKLYTPLATTSGGVVLGASGDFNVTRATTSTRVNASGNIEVVASGIPRLDYFASGGVVGCPALLVEPSAQNSALQSQDFTTTWAATNIAVSGNTTGTLDPYGTNLADLLTATASGSARVVQTFSFVSGTTYTYSCFAKAGNGFFGMTMENGGVASGVAVIWNVSTGAFSVSGSVGSGYTLQAHNIENYGNGWYRCSMRVLLGSTVAGNIRVNTSNGTMSSAIVQSDNGNSVNVFGAQLETGSVATSYIPTTTGSVTRNADVINVTGAVSGCIGQASGTIYWDIAYVVGVLTGTGNPEVGVRNQALTNWIALTSNGPSSPFRITARTTGAVVLINYTANITSGKAALAWSSAGLVLYVNGVSVATSATNPNFSFSRADIGNTSTMPFKANAFALYTERLTNEQLAALTAP
jgi:hypothetical protein